MSGRAKHALRSRKTRSNNYSVFNGFAVKASRIKDASKLRSHGGYSLIEKLKNMFKHQDR